MSDPQISPIVPSNALAIKRLQQQEAHTIAQQVESKEDISQYLETAVFKPLEQRSKFEDLQALAHPKQKPEAEEEQLIGAIEAASDQTTDETAARFQKNNYELSAQTLKILLSQIKPGSTPDEILAKVLAIYADPSLADEALDFLIQTLVGELAAAAREAKKQLNESRKREIAAGRNMGAYAREFAKEGLGSATSLRDLYREITGKPRDPLVLFEELTEKFPYAKLKKVILFLLHSLGSDLKSKGPSIERAELTRLIEETRSLQGILGIFRFFQSRMNLIHRECTHKHQTLPPRIDFEVLSRIFVKLVAERFMNADKILQLSQVMGIKEQILAQVILFTQMRDALRQISPRYFRNQRHYDELLKAFIDAIDKLEDQLEEQDDGPV